MHIAKGRGMNIVSKEMNEEFDRRIDRGIEKSKEWIRSHTYGSASQKAGLAVGSILGAMKTPEPEKKEELDPAKERNEPSD